MTNQMKQVKKTEIGLIPEDWEVKVIDQLVSRVGDGIHTTPNYDESGSYYFINGNNLSNGRILFNESTKKVSVDEYKIHKRDLSDTTILLSINGTIGNVAFFRNEPVLLGKSAAYLNISSNAKKEYLFYQLQTAFVQEYFYNNLTGSTIKNLGLGTIRSTPIPLPPTLEEQQAIASALIDVDELIRSLDVLIQKKQAIKKGTMQQLLTGKKRLSGFKDKWELISLKHLTDRSFELFNDGDWVESEHIIDQGVRLLQTGNVGVGKFKESRNKKYINELSFKKLNCKEVKVGDLLICRLADPPGRACIVPDLREKKMITSVDVSILRPKEGAVDKYFLLQVFSTNKWFH